MKTKHKHGNFFWMRQLIHGALIGSIIGFVLGFADFYLGMLFVEINLRTYVGFWIAYIVICTLLSIAMKMVVNLFSNSNKFNINYHVIYFGCVLFLYDFVYVNAKLVGGFHILTIRGIFVNLLLLGGMLGLIKLCYKVKNHFLDSWRFLQIALITFHFTAAFNYFILNFPSPPQNILTILFLLFLIIAIPLLAMLIKNGYDKLFLMLTKSQLTHHLLGLSAAILIVLCIPLIISYPNLSSYQSKHDKSTKIQSSKVNQTPNVIWIVLDTARRDHFSCYGYHRKTTSNIDEFARDGVVFTNYISTSPWTLPSHGSMFTGMYPSKHGAHNRLAGDGPNPLFKENITIAEILNEHGFNTCGVAANSGILNRLYQFDQGFNFYFADAAPSQYFFWGFIFKAALTEHQKYRFKINDFRLSSDINHIALHWLKKNKSDPFFLFINYMEPHDGIKHLPQPFRSMYGFNWKKFYQKTSTIDYKEIVHQKRNITVGEQQVLIDWYDCKLTYLDFHIGQLLNKLKQFNVYDNSMIIIVSDHGELFGEHNSFGHETDLYNELIHVPLIIKYPKAMNLQGVNDKFIQTVDLMPEILSVLNVPPSEDIQGQPIADADHEIVAELNRHKNIWWTVVNPKRYYRNLRCIISHKQKYPCLKYIQSSLNEDSELYNLSDDYDEQHNIISQMDSTADEIDQKLANWSKSFKSIKTVDKNKNQFDKKLKERLKALGYIK